jgi:hypothetical protein
LSLANGQVTFTHARGPGGSYPESVEKGVSVGDDRTEAEPEAWRDDLGRSPEDMLLAYARDRHDFDAWFLLSDADGLARSRLRLSAELLARYPERLPDDTREEQIANRWRKLYREYATSSMPDDSPPSHGRPHSTQAPGPTGKTIGRVWTTSSSRFAPTLIWRYLRRCDSMSGRPEDVGGSTESPTWVTVDPVCAVRSSSGDIHERWRTRSQYPSTMHGRLISLKTVDGEDLASVARAPGSFATHVRAMVGPSDGPGEESFDLLVCNAMWLSGELTKGFRWGHGLLVVSDWDLALVERAVSDLVSHASGPDWRHVAEKLARYADWEFADYHD